MLPRFTGTSYKAPGKFAVETKEGAAPVQEAIDYLSKAPTVSRRRL
jgi:hypothetical protein